MPLPALKYNGQANAGAAIQSTKIAFKFTPN